MKIITPILLAGATLAFCACSTDKPIFANEATQENEAERSANTANGSAAGEQQRDVYNSMNSGANMGGSNGVGAGPSGATARAASAGAGMSH